MPERGNVGCGRAARGVCLALGVVSCFGFVPATASARVVRLLDYQLTLPGTNGYDLQLSASHQPDGGGSAVLSATGTTGSAYYVQRDARVSRHRITADFGELGSVDYRFRGKLHGFGADSGIIVTGGTGRCGIRFSSGNFPMRGHLDFEGEDGYTRGHQGATRGFAFRVRRRFCGHRNASDRRPLLRKSTNGAALSSCSSQSGVGFFVVEHRPGGIAQLLATKTERTPELEIYRLLNLTGRARSFDAEPGLRAAAVRPPAPLIGRAHFNDGVLSGNLRATLPGADEMRLTPGDGRLERRLDFRHPVRCLPPLFSQARSAGASSRAIVANQIVRSALSPSARRLLVPGLAPAPFPKKPRR